MSIKQPAASTSPALLEGILKRFGEVVFTLVLMGVIVFLSAGRLDWIWGWVYLAISLATILCIGTILLRTSPDTIAERGQPKEIKKWDAILGGIWGFFQFLVIPLAAGLDFRLGWSEGLSVWWNIAGAFLYAGGMALFGWGMIVNAYFSTVVRIQTDRGHQVCRSGPYRFVRHPGYLGSFLQSIGTAVVLGSLWAIIPAVIAMASMTLRTAFEDKMLQAELPGYKQYAQEVRYRLIPWIW